MSIIHQFMIEQEKFSRLRFKIHKVPQGKKAEDHFPGLFKWKEFESYKHPAKRKQLAYLIFLYDPNSDLIDEFVELSERKDAAAIEAGFERNESGDWTPALKKIMALNDTTFIPAVLRYLKICNNTTWREICTLEIELDRMYELRLQPIPDIGNKDASEIYKKRAELSKMCGDGVDKLKSLYIQFFADNDDLKGKTKDELVPISPENVFKILTPLKNVS